MSSLLKDSNLFKIKTPEMKSYSIIFRPFMAIACLLIMSGPNFANYHVWCYHLPL